MVLFCFAYAEGEKKPFTVDDAVNMVSVSNPLISPDGKWIIFSKDELKWEDNKQERYLWLVSADGGEPFKYTNTEGDSSPRWSPDGEYLAFLRGKEEKRQVWMMRTSGGEATQTTEHEGEVSSFRWSADSQNLMTGVDEVIKQGIADPEKMGVRGWSYGGILGGWALTKTDRFKAASLGAMVSDWISEYGMSFSFEVRLWYIGGTPGDNPQGYREMSSLTHIENVKTPVILFHGERDTTCTIGQSLNYFTYLHEMGKTVRFLRFPREPHGFREPHHQRIRMVEEIAWMQKYIRGMDWACERPKEKKEEKNVGA